MPTKPNPFAWYELMTTDAEGAKRFYHAVLGWTARLQPASPVAGYEILSAGDIVFGGLLPMASVESDPEMRPAWIGYVGVADVDAAAAQVVALGGQIYKEPQPIPGVGSFAVVGDPSGAALVLFNGLGDAPPPVAPGTPGLVGWHELYSCDTPAAALAFYSALFGWTEAGGTDMGPIGYYQMFAAGGPPIGGMMTKPPSLPVAHWTYYFNVEGIDAAIARVTAAGGEIVNGPHQVPTGQWIVHARDPQGAMFALLGPQ